MVASALRCLLEELVVGMNESSSVMEDSMPWRECCAGMVLLVAIIRLSSVVMIAIAMYKLLIAIRYLLAGYKSIVIST